MILISTLTISRHPLPSSDLIETIHGQYLMASYEDDSFSSLLSSSVANLQDDSSHGLFHSKGFQADLNSLDHELSNILDEELDHKLSNKPNDELNKLLRRKLSSASEESSSGCEDMKASDETHDDESDRCVNIRHHKHNDDLEDLLEEAIKASKDESGKFNHYIPYSAPADMTLGPQVHFGIARTGIPENFDLKQEIPDGCFSCQFNAHRSTKPLARL